MLDYDRKRVDNALAVNLCDLYHVNSPLSDTYLRERLDRYVTQQKKRSILVGGGWVILHDHLTEQLETSEKTIYHELRTEEGFYHQFRFLNGASLNKSNQDVKVNILEYRCTDLKGKELNFSWVTNIRVSKNNALKIAIGRRARWKIENETFNKLKNLGYNFEHNYGHGKKYLSKVFCMLMMLAFLIDQVQELSCSLFKRCRKLQATYRNLWECMRTLFNYVLLGSWERFYLTILKEIALDTS